MPSPRLTRAVLSLALAATTARASLPLPDADNGGITLPPGFRAIVVADKLKPLRNLVVAPNGDLYLKTRTAGIYGLRDIDGDGRADMIREFGAGGGTGIALRDGWLYHSSNDAVYRYRLTPGELVPAGEPERIVRDLPDKRQHNAKAFAFGADGRLYVEVGSPSNALGQPDRAPGAVGQDPTEFLKTYGGFWRFDADKPDQTPADGFHFSTGHRHATTIALNPANGRLFIAIHGRDQLNTVAPQAYSEDDNAELPAEVLHELTEGADFGWPTTYWDPLKKQRMLNPEYGGDGKKTAHAGKFPDPLVAFPAHWSPMQLAFYTGTQFPEKYRGGAFLAFQGSWNRAPRPQRGYNVVFIPFDAAGRPAGTYEVFADNFAGKSELASPGDAVHRPNGVAVGPDGSLYVADAQKGRVWRIFYTGETADTNAAARSAGDALRRPVYQNVRGRQVYEQVCASCHMMNGSGVPNLQPSLIDSKVVTGDVATLVSVILKGPARVLPANRPAYANAMPGYETFLNDAQVADLATYLRQTFAGQGAPVSVEEVAVFRKLP